MASAQQEDRHFEIDHLATSVLFVAPTCCKDGSAGYAALRSGAVEAPPVLRRQALGHGGCLDVTCGCADSPQKKVLLCRFAKGPRHDC